MQETLTHFLSTTGDWCVWFTNDWLIAVYDSLSVRLLSRHDVEVPKHSDWTLESICTITGYTPETIGESYESWW